MGYSMILINFNRGKICTSLGNNFHSSSNFFDGLIPSYGEWLPWEFPH